MKRSSNLMVSGLLFAFMLAIQGGCAGTAKVTQPAAQTAPENKDATSHAVYEAPILAGKVVETMNAKNYTYICLEKDGKRGWSAVPAVPVAVGQDIQIKPGTEMGKFTSSTLNRSFDNIVFSPGLVTDAPGQLPQEHPALDNMGQLPQGHPDIAATSKPTSSEAMPGMASAPVKLDGKVVETFDSGGYTYICLEKDRKKTWAAVPAAKVTLGDQIELKSGMAMPNFTSKSLNRTFDTIIFSAGVVPKN
jgi:hypothetical protein